MREISTNYDLTVVVPAFNAEASIGAAVMSAHAAGARRVIVVDDGSTDRTSEAAIRAGADVVSQPNAGASAARSRGAELVDTDYVTFLDADDELLADGVARSITLLEADPELAVAAGRVMGFVGRGEATLLPPTYTDVNSETLLVNGYGPWPPGAAVQRTSLMREAEIAKPDPLRPRYAEDYELLIRLSLVGRIVRHDVPSLRYEMAGGKSARAAGAALSSKEAIREYYATHLGVSIDMMTPMRMRAAANKRVARADLLRDARSRAAKRLALAYIYGALSLFQRPRRISVPSSEAQSEPRTTGKPIVVMEATTRPPDGSTRYIDQVVTYSNPQTSFTYFTWKRAFFGKYDVIHVHWPEILVRKSTVLRSVLASLLLTALIVELRIRRIPIVRTLHNLTPHEPGGWIERIVLALVDRATTIFVTINPVTKAPNGRGAYIPHGHYRDRFSQIPTEAPEPGHLVYAGLIRPYKGIERLVGAFKGLNEAGPVSLRIVGKPTPNLKRFVETAVAQDARMSARLEFVPDSVLVAEVTRAELVCLPYDELHNSGMALVALSLNRPLLVPDTETTRKLADEVGAGWIHFFRGVLDSEQLAAALEENREAKKTRGAQPSLSGRDWEKIGQQYDEVFRDATVIRRRPRFLAAASRSYFDDRRHLK